MKLLEEELRAARDSYEGQNDALTAADVYVEAVEQALLRKFSTSPMAAAELLAHINWGSNMLVIDVAELDISVHLTRKLMEEVIVNKLADHGIDYYFHENKSGLRAYLYI